MASLESTLTHMDIFLGDACNLRCVHCQCWINDRAPLFGAQVLEARLFEAIEYVATQCPQFEKVMLIGGEPFVHEGVPRFLQKQRIDTEITVYTNFVWPDPDITLPDNVFFLSSLDAAQQDVYGQLRRTKDFAYSQENMRRHADRLIHVDTTVSKGNVRHLDAILDITQAEGFDCTHWFLPIDPRLVRYADHLTANPSLGTRTELDLAVRTARRTQSILLDKDDLREVERFYRRRGTERTNDFETFLGIYLSGVDSFQEEEFPYNRDMSVKRPAFVDQRCPGILKYMEIAFTASGEFVPRIHCPELSDMFPAGATAEVCREGPPVATFAELMEWENSTRPRAKCDVFCGSTQFLGLDEYEDVFRDVVLGEP